LQFGRSQLLILLFASAAVVLAVEEGLEQEGEFGRRIAPRDGKSLRNSFPFNAAAGGHAQQHHHHHHQENAISSARQAVDDGPALDIGTIAAAGSRCIDKVITVEETEYDDVIKCKHSYTERCHTTYKTDYTPAQEEECTENFRKNCHIEFKKVAVKERVTSCFQPLVRNCDIPGPTECLTEYTTQCITRFTNCVIKSSRF